MDVEAEFEEPELFQSRYQRNNKRGGLKNLRCFPTCAALHRERGFCGRMVVLKIKNACANNNLVVYGEFLPVSDKNGGLKVGEVVMREKAKEICRDKSNPTKPWMEGELLEPQGKQIRFAFNRDKKGWHYGWASNKHTCNASHALHAYVLEEESPEKLVVRGVFRSPEFTLFCRRRRRFAMVPSAPIAPPSSKKRGKPSSEAGARKDGDDDDEEEDEDEEVDQEEETAAVTVPKPNARTSPRVDKSSSKAPSAKRRKHLVVEETPQAAQNAARVARVERMLRELSKRSAHRSKPVVVISRPNSPGGQEMFSATDSASTSTGDDHQLTQAQFISHLFECLDYVSGDSLLDDQILAGDFLDRPSEADDEKARLVDQLAEYLLEERGFTDAIYGLSKAARASKISADADQAAFDSFVLILESYLETFLSRQNFTLRKFDELFPSESTGAMPYQSGAEILARSAFQQIMENEPASPEPSEEDNGPVLLFDTAGVEKMNGSWILASGTTLSDQPIAAGDDGIESIRESLGYPWILRKMLSFMEEKFQVTVNGTMMSVRLQRKMFASGAMNIVLDGEEHDWGMKLPMFEGISSVWKYRAWVNEGVVHHVHETGDGLNTRMKRSMWVDEEDSLNIDVSLEEYNAEQGHWDTIARALQRAVRCD